MLTFSNLIRMRHTASIICSAATLAFLMSPATRACAPQAPAPRVLIVGGGPDKDNNQVAIESNVRYLGRLLPAGIPRTILFADGSATNPTVLYDAQAEHTPGRRLLTMILSRDGDESDGRFRKPSLGGHLDGASRKSEISRVFAQIDGELARNPDIPLLLYFTGHGSSNRENLDNNYYDLWGENQTLSVQDLAREIAGLPADTPVALVMVQCFSGAFANLVFEGGSPNNRAVNRDIAGFFATVRERVAAGCTSAVNEADYHDFTSYFFAALTGRDRLGRRVQMPDYNADGRVGMNEAYCYTLLNDDSIDVPVCTSDVFLRRYLPATDDEVFRTPFHQVREWASDAQRAALDGLSARLHCDGEDRLAVTYRQFFGQKDERTMDKVMQLSREFDAARVEAKRVLLRRWPALGPDPSSASPSTLRGAQMYLSQHSDNAAFETLNRLAGNLDDAHLARERAEIAQSMQLRFVRLGKSVILGHRMMAFPDSAVKARYLRLVADEARTPFRRFPTLIPQPLRGSGQLRHLLRAALSRSGRDVGAACSTQ